MTPTPSAVQSIFGHALEIESATDRAAYLDEACGADADLRGEVEGLLATLGRAGDFMCRPAAAVVEPTGSYPAVTEGPGTRVGPYKLLQQIGEGGMGIVYMADQEEPVRRRVALKIIKPGMDSKQVVARFEAERQALAMMDHTNIARVFDAGTTESGRPYFVMELVHGVPITQYCDANKLTPRQRLELFVPVCHAIQHAHQKGIIHRDVKPSNILVTMYDDKPVPKVIDFGVAKAVEQRLTDKTLFTQFGTLVGTFEYMSPEQAEMNAFGVDTRSDVYSLGVLLYELLTGTTPLERKRLRDAALGEVVRLIKEEEPPRPSARLSTSGALAKVAAARQTEPAKLARLMRGELDWVVMRCLEKDRTRRYETANDLARDVERYLKDEPVEACPPSAAYRLRKFARRYNRALAVAAAFTLLLLVGFGMVTWKWQDERAARRDADAARRVAEDRKKEIEAGVERMNASNAAMDLGASHVNHYRWSAAEAEYTRAIRLRQDHSQPWFRRGYLYAGLGLWDSALADLAQAFDFHEPDAVSSWYDHAVLLLEKGDVAGYQRLRERMLAKFAAVIDRLHRTEDAGKNEDLRFTRFNLARACSLAPAKEEADRLLPLTDVSAARGASVWVPYYIRGLACHRAGRHDEAIRWLRESLSKGDNNEAIALNHPVLAMALHKAGQADAVRQELEFTRVTLDRWAEVVFTNPTRPLPLSLGKWYDWVECRVLYREALRQIDNASPPEDARLLAVRGRALAVLRRHDQADLAYAQAVQVAPTDHRIRLHHFRHLVSRRRLDAADKELAEAARLRPTDAAIHLYAFRACADLGQRDRASAAHNEAVRLKPDVRTRLERHLYYVQLGDAAEAEKALAEVAASRPDDPAFHALCGDVLAESGLWRNARKAYSRAIDLGTADGMVWNKHALIQLLLDDEKAYRQTFAALLARHGTDPSPTTARSLWMVGRLAPHSGADAKRLHGCFDRWAAAAPKDAARFRSVALFRAGRDDEAFDELVNRKAVGDLLIVNQTLLSRFHLRKGEVGEADRLMNTIDPWYRRLDPWTPNHPTWYVHLTIKAFYREAEVEIQSQCGRDVADRITRRQWADAVRLMDKRNKTLGNHKHAPYWTSYGNCLAEVGRWKDAEAAFARAYELTPNDGEATRGLATVRLRLGDREGYRKLCAELIERHGTATEPFLLNQAAQLCVCVPDSGIDPDTVMRLAKKAAEGQPDNHYVRRTLGRALFRAGNDAEAVRELQKTVELSKSEANPRDWLFLAMAHARLREKDRAREYLKQSVAWMDRYLKEDGPVPGGGDYLYLWELREKLALLRREAEAMIETRK